MCPMSRHAVLLPRLLECKGHAWLPPVHRGGKSTEKLYSSTSTVTLLKLYSITSKSTGIKTILK